MSKVKHERLRTEIKGLCTVPLTEKYEIPKCRFWCDASVLQHIDQLYDIKKRSERSTPLFRM